MKPSVLIFCFCIGLTVSAADPLPVYLVPKVPDTATPQNMNSEEFWKESPPSGKLNRAELPNNAKVLSQPTDFQVIYNSRYFFVRVNAAEEKANSLDFSRNPGERDAGNVFSIPNVEFFLDPEFTRSEAAQIVVNIRGGIYDRFRNNVNWNHPVESLVTHDSKGWTLFVAFPWKDRGMDNVFGMQPAANPLIGFNLCRNRGIGAAEVSQWSVTGNAFMRPAAFGVLVMTGEAHVRELVRRHFTGTLISGGIEIQGASRGFSDLFPTRQDFYRNTLRESLLQSDRLLKMAPEAGQKEFSGKIASIRERLKENSSEEQLKGLLKECSTLNVELEKKTFDALQNDLLKEF